MREDTAMKKRKWSTAAPIVASIVLVLALIALTVELLLTSPAEALLTVLPIPAGAMLVALFFLGMAIGRKDAISQEEMLTSLVVGVDTRIADYLAQTLLQNPDDLKLIIGRILDSGDESGAEIRRAVTHLIARHLYDIALTPEWQRIVGELYPRQRALADFEQWLVGLRHGEIMAIAEGLGFEPDSTTSLEEAISTVMTDVKRKGDRDLMATILVALEHHHIPALSPETLSLAHRRLLTGLAKYISMERRELASREGKRGAEILKFPGSGPGEE
jgi:hypothetical protein